MSSSSLIVLIWTLLVLASAPCRAQLEGATLLEQSVAGYADASVDPSEKLTQRDYRANPVLVTPWDRYFADGLGFALRNRYARGPRAEA